MQVKKDFVLIEVEKEGCIKSMKGMVLLRRESLDLLENYDQLQTTYLSSRLQNIYGLKVGRKLLKGWCFQFWTQPDFGVYPIICVKVWGSSSSVIRLKRAIAQLQQQNPKYIENALWVLTKPNIWPLKIELLFIGLMFLFIFVLLKCMGIDMRTFANSSPWSQ